jgi:hypothetical protein
MAMVGSGCSSWRLLEFFAQVSETSRTVQFWLWECSCHVCDRASIARTRGRTGGNNLQQRLFLRFVRRPREASNRILRGADQSNERCDACMDTSWHQVESCEGREKVDCQIDLGFKRGSIVQDMSSGV